MTSEDKCFQNPASNFLEIRFFHISSNILQQKVFKVEVKLKLKYIMIYGHLCSLQKCSNSQQFRPFMSARAKIFLLNFKVI